MIYFKYENAYFLGKKVYLKCLFLYVTNKEAMSKFVYSSYLPGHTVSIAGENISSEVTSAVKFFTIEASHELGKQDAKVMSIGIPLDNGYKNITFKF